MLRKIVDRIFNNLGLKIAAAILAVIFWMVILNIEDPDKTKVFTVEVEIVNEEYLTDMGKTYEVLNNTDTISFTATGRRSIIESLDSSDFKVTADLENIVNMSEVPITISATRYAASLDISNKTQYLELNVEDVISGTYEIKVQTSGEPASACSVEASSASPETVTVEGPESVVEQIESAAVSVDISSADDDFTETASIVLYDGDGLEVSQDRLTLSESEAEVSIQILQTKTIVLEFETSGTPPDGYRVTEVTGSADSILVEGSKSALADLDSITIGGSDLSVSSLEETTEVTVKLADYLPDDVALASGQSSTLTISIEMEGTVEQEYAMPTANISVVNLGDGLSVTWSTETVKVTLVGYSSDLEEIEDSDLTGVVNLLSLKAGEHSVVVAVDGDYETAKTVKASLTISEESEEDSSDETTEE